MLLINITDYLNVHLHCDKDTINKIKCNKYVAEHFQMTICVNFSFYRWTEEECNERPWTRKT